MLWTRLSIALIVSILGAAPAPGALLYDNGPVVDPDSGGWCSARTDPNVCQGNGDWTFYDDFVLAADAQLTSLDFVDWFGFSFGASVDDYAGTVWSIYDDDPFTSSPIASGTAVAVLTATGPPDQFQFEIGGLDISLSGGTHYWLGTQNIIALDEDLGIIPGFTTIAAVDPPGGGLDASKLADSAGNQLDLLTNRAFRLHGTPVPEPSTGLLVAGGLIALGTLSRFSRTSRPGARSSG